jgi:hypothetical protein
MPIDSIQFWTVKEGKVFLTLFTFFVCTGVVVKFLLLTKPRDETCTMCPDDNATAGSWAGVGLATEIWICCGIGRTYSI